LVSAEAEALVTFEALATEGTGWVGGNCAAFAAGTLASFTPFGSPAGCLEAELATEGLDFAALDAGLS
jgi:hypothetical protein